MRKIVFLVLTWGILFAQVILSQTPGTLTFTMTTTSTGGYSPRHLLAIWIENNAGNFIKTKVKYSSTSNYDHLAIWDGKSNRSLVDATSGSTRNTHGVITIMWNGTNTAGTVVADGSYRVWVEMAWGDNLTTGKTSTSYLFTKGSSTVNLTPSGSTNFSGISLNWVPLNTAIKENIQSEVNVYPNPTDSRINIALSSSKINRKVEIINLAGIKIYEENVSPNEKIKTIDLSKYPDGVYFVNVESGEKLIVTRVVKAK